MAIVVDAISGAVVSELQVNTVAHTVGSGGSRVLIVTASGRFSGGFPGQRVTSVTYNGTSCTEVVFKITTETWTSIWMLKNPDVGTHNIVVTMLDNATRSFQASGLSLFKANGNEADNTATGGAGSGRPSTNLTPTIDNTILIDCFASYSANVLTKGAGQTQIFQGEAQSDYQGSSYEAVESAGATTMDWTGGDSDNWAQSVISISSGSLGGAFLLNFI